MASAGAGRRALISGIVIASLTVPAAAAGGSEPEPPRGLPAAATKEAAQLRLLSSPDFLNADIADLRKGPGFWTKKRSENGTSPSYERALGQVLDDWASHDPAAVLVAGDLVNGRWGRDEHRTGNFGPVGTRAEQRAALRRAAATYYPQYLQRFREHGLDVYPAIGDHEYGDNDWDASKRALAPDYADAFARYFTTKASGEPRFADRPTGRHARTAYAWRPHPDVQVVSIDVFDITARSAHVRLDRPQMTWLKGVLRQARRDGVTWTVVQGHTPIVGPVRTRGSSGLQYDGGRSSKLWKVFRKLGVDLYLCGEVHAITATKKDGIVQLAHGGMFPFNMTSYALLDFFSDRLEITVSDYDMQFRDAEDGSRLWETQRGGMRKLVTFDGKAHLRGTLTLTSDGDVTTRTGMLQPWPG